MSLKYTGWREVTTALICEWRHPIWRGPRIGVARHSLAACCYHGPVCVPVELDEKIIQAYL